MSHYSNSRSAGPLASAMSTSEPKPLHEAPTTNTGQGVDRVGTALSNGNYLNAVGDFAQLPDRLIADAATQGGQAVKKDAENDGYGAFKTFTSDNSGLLDKAGAAVDLTNACLQHTVGEGIKAVGDGMSSLGRYRDNAWNYFFE